MDVEYIITFGCVNQKPIFILGAQTVTAPIVELAEVGGVSLAQRYPDLKWELVKILDSSPLKLVRALCYHLQQTLLVCQS